MAGPHVLLLTPPLTQLNTPYPATAYLTGFLRSRGIDADQADLGIDMVLRLFSRSGLQLVLSRCASRRLHCQAKPDRCSPSRLPI
ncbi:hypothetical protein EMGBD2_01150 [Nitrospirota bacterium]|nr:hypothetical protein EMGBD2_01150 [Nitrospirota bacterium]